jgi:GNAT superfamily N-acetyltransferase
MKSWESGLTVHTSDIVDPLNIIRVIENGDIAGFYFLRLKTPTSAKLRFFFIDPSHQRKGIGSVLFRDIVSIGKGKGIHSIMIESDPHAEIFYIKCGAIVTGYTPPDTVEGQSLLLLEYRIQAN